ncbi:MAG: hypothetical protein NVS4B3_04760 [Gemmatimonadaceae bacterium]
MRYPRPPGEGGGKGDVPARGEQPLWGPTHTDRDVEAAPPQHDGRPFALFIGASLVLAAGVAAHYVAWRGGFDARLGSPLLIPAVGIARQSRAACLLAAISAMVAWLIPSLRRASAPLLIVAVVAALGSTGPIYSPHRLVFWYARYGTRAARGVFAIAAVLAAVVAAVVGMAAGAWRRQRPGPPSQSHGSAHWGRGHALASESGLLLGRFGGRLLRHGGEGHVVTVAPTRSGKGISCVIPNLLDYSGSLVVTDPKGENFAVTAQWRADHGHMVYAFDPFGITNDGVEPRRVPLATYNPLCLVDVDGPGAADDARLLADMLVVPEGRGSEQAFWNEEARGVLGGLILHAAARPRRDERTLTHVREMLTLPPAAFSALLREMEDSKAAGGLVARAAARLLQKAEKERSGVLSTAQSHTHFLDSPRMAAVLGNSTADLSSLKRSQASVYLILPADRLDGYARWLRLMIACALVAVTREAGRAATPVLFLLDEFAHLGRLEPVQRGIGLAGGFGIIFWLVVQDFSQLRNTYGDAWPTFLANADVLQAFGANDWDTAEYLSKMTGEATIRVVSDNESRGVSRGRQSQRQQGSARSTAEKGRRLLLPDEVRRLPHQAQLLFVRGHAPVLATRVDYLTDPQFAGRASRNPLYSPVAFHGRTGVV